MNRIVISAMALAGLAMSLAAPRSTACSRVVYPGDSALYIVGRSLDWKTPIPTNLYVYPSMIFPGLSAGRRNTGRFMP